MKRQIKAALLSPRMKSLVDRIESAVPLVRKWHRFEYEQHFLRIAKWERLFSGVYPTFPAASAAIPAGRNNSYDNPESATFLGHRATLRASDYPVLFWLSKLLPHHPKVFDFGGYLGISYYSFARLIEYPACLEWKIYDVPAVVAAGEELAQKNNDRRISFTTSFADAANYSLLLAFGSLQFPEPSFSDLLKQLDHPPEHVLLNKLPLTDLPTFYTLHNMGPALAPYRVANRAEFMKAMAELGYEVVDSWENPDFGCYIPHYPDHSVRSFSGMYLRRRDKPNPQTE